MELRIVSLILCSLITATVLAQDKHNILAIWGDD